ncbi:MAG: hypothetical protein AAFY48_16745 [Bacteroidota bacterium]
MLRYQRTCLLCSLILGVFYLTAQERSEPRSLSVLTEEADTVDVRVEYDDDGSIAYLFQSYLSYRNGVTYIHQEEYKKDKYWTLWQFMEVLKKERRRSSVYKPVLHGKQYQFTMDGYPLFIDEYDVGSANAVFQEWEYYPDGTLKYIAEIKDKRYYNYLVYYYPDGSAHDFGDFLNGTGTVVHLDDAGNPCLECQQQDRKAKGRLLCDEEKED